MLAVRNKKKGYYIRIIDIAEKRVVKHVDMSDNEDYKIISVAEQCRIGILYAISFLKSKNIEGDSGYSYETPIFSVWERELVNAFHYRVMYMEYMNRKNLQSSIDILKFKLMKEIGSVHNFEIFQWKKKRWGDEPIYDK